MIPQRQTSHGESGQISLHDLPRPQGLIHLITEEVRTRFRDSAWCNVERYFSQADLHLAYELLRIVALETTASNVSLVIHLQTTARCARALAEQFNQALPFDQAARKLNPYLAEALALVHDLGRFSTHAWYLNDLFLHQVLQHLEVDLSLRAAVLWPDDAFNPTRKFSDLQRVLICADMLSKVDLQTGEIRTMDEGIRYHVSSRGCMKAQTGYPIESRKIAQFQGGGQRGKSEAPLLQPDLTEKWADVYREMSGAYEEMGIDLRSIQHECQQGARSSLHKPLVIFDLGGVAFKLADGELVQTLATALAIDPSRIHSFVNNTTKLAAVQSGKTSERAWYESMYEELFSDDLSREKEYTVNTIQRVVGDLTIETHREVLEYASDLREEGYIVVALSDTIPAHIPIIRKSLEGAFDRIFCSPEIGVSKKSELGYLSFWVVIAAVGVEKMCCGYTPQQVLFHDDRDDCCAAAERIGIKTVVWRGNPEGQGHLELIAQSRRELAN